jgi:hypothetical protein
MNLLWQAIRSWLAGNRYPLLLALLIVLAIYPFSFFLFIPKWDSIIGYLPYRYFIGEYVSHGHLPLWSPFQRLGYPGYSDLQSGASYPVVWILLLFGKYTITSLMVEVIFTFLIAGLGMYRLSLSFVQCPKTSLLVGLAYALSGFMTGSTQLLVFLIGVAWLPWCIWSFRRWLISGNASHALVAVGFLAMNITGASPAFTIILAYILTAMLLWHVVAGRSDFSRIKTIAWQGLAGLIFLGILLAPYVKSYVDFAPYFNRAGKLPFEAIILNPFTLSTYISFVFPYSVISNSDWFELTDLSLRNGYFGIIGLFGVLLVLLSIRRIQGNSHRVLAACGVFALWLAMGNETVLYKWMYALPGFGYFRHPSFFRAYAILCFLLLAAIGLKSLLNENRLGNRERLMIIILSSAVALATGVMALQVSSDTLKQHVTQILNGQEFLNSPLESHVMINGLIILVLLSVVWLLHRTFKWSLFTSVLLFSFADLSIQTSLTARTTMVYPIRYSSARAYFDQLPESHDQRYNATPMRELDDTQGLLSAPGFELNLATFNQVPSIVGENPLRFRSFDLAKENEIMSRNLLNPLMYVATHTKTLTDSARAGHLWHPRVDKPLSSLMLSDVRMDYNAFTAEVSNAEDTPGWIVLNQNFHHCWKAFLGEQELPVHMVNNLVMGVEIPPYASGVLRFEYTSNWLLQCLAAGIAGWIIWVALLMIKRRT